eukprot:5627934-Prymnesium_polylepis.1
MTSWFLSLRAPSARSPSRSSPCPPPASSSAERAAASPASPASPAVPAAALRADPPALRPASAALPPVLLRCSLLPPLELRDVALQRSLLLLAIVMPIVARLPRAPAGDRPLRPPVTHPYPMPSDPSDFFSVREHIMLAQTRRRTPTLTS